MESLTTKTRFIELRAKGYSYDKISKEIGVAKNTLIDWGKDLDSEIANLKALELEALYEKHHLLKEHRIKTFGSILSNIKEELSNRDLSEVPTDKLLELFLKFENQLKEELIEPQYKTSKDIREEKADKELLEQFTAIPEAPEETYISKRKRLKTGS